MRRIVGKLNPRGPPVAFFPGSTVGNLFDKEMAHFLDGAFSVAGEPFSMRRGETIHTENSPKFTFDQLQTMIEASGRHLARCATDVNRHFAALLLKAA